jgi:hypothetical protein
VDAVALAKAFSRKRPKGGKLSLRAVSAAMAAQGFLNERGAPFNHKSIATMLEQNLHSHKGGVSRPSSRVARNQRDH